MDAYARLPPGLRPPAGGEVVEIGWQVDLGSDIRVGDLARHLEDLDTALTVGESWGVELGRASERWLLIRELGREGPGALRRAARRLGLSPEDLDLLDEWWHRWGWGPRDLFGLPADLIGVLGDMQGPSKMGRPIYLGQAEYQNPVDLSLYGAAFLLLGALQVLRFVRDWSGARRRGEAQARVSEAAAGEAEARTELYRWLVEEAKAGRVLVPPGDLLKIVSPADLRALGRLAATDVTLRLPPGTDAGEDESASSEQ